jgi:hypothetical protein
MINYYHITTFVVLLTAVKVADKAQSGARHLPDQGAAASREGRLARQRSRGLRRDVRLRPSQRGVQSHLRAELTQLTEEGVIAPLWGGRSRPQDPEAAMIHYFSLSISFSY